MWTIVQGKPKAGMVKAWEPNAKNDRAKFGKGGKESVRKMIMGLGALSRGELAGERMEVALNSQTRKTNTPASPTTRTATRGPALRAP